LLLIGLFYLFSEGILDVNKTGKDIRWVVIGWGCGGCFGEKCKKLIQDRVVFF